MAVDLRQLFVTFRRRLWLLLLIPAIAAVVAYGVTSRQAPVYNAASVVMVNPTTATGTADYYAILSSQSLVETYRQLVETRPVMEAVIAELELPMTVSELQQRITATKMEGTQLVRITASDTDPDRAAAIANSTASQFAAFVATQAAQASGSFRAVLDSQIQQTKEQIDATALQIQEIQSKPAPSADDQAQLDVLRTQLQQLQTTYGQLLGTSNTMVLNAAAAQAQVTISESATAPSAPSSPQVALRTGLGLFAGVLIAAGTVLALEYLDDTVRFSTDFGAAFGIPLLGSLEKRSKIKDPRKQLFILDKSNQQYQEAIRLLRTNLELMISSQGIRSIAFSSPMAGDGTSTVVANLAVAMARVDVPVVLIDANMRQPMQHQIFQTRNDAGLSAYLSRPGLEWDAVAVASGIPSLTIIPAGPLPQDPADVLDRRFGRLVDELKQAGFVTVIDAPPMRSGSDPLIISSTVDGIILVCRAHRTRTGEIHDAISLIAPTGTNVIGIVLNQVDPRGRDDRLAGRGQRVDLRGTTMAPLPAPPAQTFARPSATMTSADGP